MSLRISLAAALLPFALVADSFTGWPVDCRPSDVSRRIARQFLSTSPDYYCPTNGYRGNRGYGFGKEIQYSVVSLWINAMECARIIGDAELEKQLVDAFTPYYGPKRHVLPKFKHVDFTIVGAVPLEIAILTGEKRARDLGLAFADQQWEEPKPDDPPPWYNKTPYETRLSWWKQGYTDQTRLWIDDAYMIAALQTQAYRLTGDRKYIDRTAKELVLYLDKLQLPNGLFYHTPDVPFVWGRGAGWMAAAMPMTLKYLPADSAYRARILEGYRKMMATLLEKQREDGMWTQLVGEADAWAETSCTAMFAYAFAEGVKDGWLDAKKYGPAFRKAYLALVARMDEFGNLSNVCEGTGARNDRAYYLARRRVNGDSHGQAALLWLCRAILEKAKGHMVEAAGSQLTADGFHKARPQDDGRMSEPELLNRKAPGFRGIWYFNQPSHDEYVYKYSGGLGTYCAGHIPMAVYSKEADKTFFTFGGTDERNTTLLQSVSYFDHKTKKLARPTVVFDKHTTDAHDNAVINMDDKGYIYLFSSSHGRSRPSRIARSERPYDISSFKVIWKGNFSYPQPFYVPGQGFLFLHAWYLKGMKMSGRSNCFMTSNADGTEWTDRTSLVFFNDGHYQRAWQFCPTTQPPNHPTTQPPNHPTTQPKIGVAFDQHPAGKGLNWRTDIFYMETSDFGKTWQNVSGETLKLPLAARDNPALALPYAGTGRNVYIKGVKFDSKGRPVILSTISKGYRAGPVDGPREWKLAKWTGSAWREIDTGIRSDNNYDFAELYIDTDTDWRLIGASEKGPQPFNPGGEIAAWVSHDAGETWKLEKRLTSDSERNQNYPRQPINVQPDFYAFWADGHGRKPSISRLYFCDKALNVYLMPLTFEGDFADPVPYAAR